MSKGRNSSRLRRVLGVSARIIVVIAGLVALYAIELASNQDEFIEQQHGELATVREHKPERDGDRLFQDITLTSTSGLVAELRILRTADVWGQNQPIVLMLGGTRTGRNAVDLVEVPGNAVFAAVDYPYTGPHKTKGLWQSLSAIPKVQQGALDTPAALMLALDWLLQQPYVDPQQVELIGISFGVPFSSVAGALDKRFSRIWLVQGGADNESWASHALSRRIDSERVRTNLARAVLFVSYGNSFQTLQRMQQISPRPMIVISARNDEFVPQGRALADAANPAIADIIWTESAHVRPKRKEVLNELLAIVHERL